jgi:hypothetical protein
LHKIIRQARVAGWHRFVLPFVGCDLALA